MLNACARRNEGSPIELCIIVTINECQHGRARQRTCSENKSYLTFCGALRA